VPDTDHLPKPKVVSFIIHFKRFDIVVNPALHDYTNDRDQLIKKTIFQTVLRGNQEWIEGEGVLHYHECFELPESERLILYEFRDTKRPNV
jgi:hypothetical protein